MTRPVLNVPYAEICVCVCVCAVYAKTFMFAYIPQTSFYDHLSEKQGCEGRTSLTVVQALLQVCIE